MTKIELKKTAQGDDPNYRIKRSRVREQREQRSIIGMQGLVLFLDRGRDGGVLLRKQLYESTG